MKEEKKRFKCFNFRPYIDIRVKIAKKVLNVQIRAVEAILNINLLWNTINIEKRDIKKTTLISLSRHYIVYLKH